MTDRMRWRYGDTNPVVAAVDADTVIEVGDLLWQDIDDAKPASAFDRCDDYGMLDVRECARTFLGVAVQRSRAGDTDPIRVSTTGVFEFDCPEGTFELGQLMAFRVEAAKAFNQSLQRHSSRECAIGRVAKRVSMATTSVLVDIRSTVMTGGIVTG